MTTSLRTSRETVKRTDTPAPRRCPVAVEMGKLLGVGERHAERRIHEARKVVDRIVDAARASDRPDYIATFFGYSDNARKIGGAPIACDSHFACAIQRSVLAEASSLTEYVADLSPTHRVALKKQTQKLAIEVAELLASLETQC